MKKIFAAIDAVSDFIGCACLGILLIAILVQVICRYVFSAPLSWPEEVAQFAFLISTYMGISICMKNHGHLRITILPEFFPKMWHSMDILSMFANVVFFIICLWLGFGLVMDAYESQMRCVGLPLDMWTILIFIPLSCLFISLQAIKNFLLLVRGVHYNHSQDESIKLMEDS